jgi:hypothetical protein
MTARLVHEWASFHGNRFRLVETEPAHKGRTGRRFTIEVASTDLLGAAQWTTLKNDGDVSFNDMGTRSILVDAILQLYGDDK